MESTENNMNVSDVPDTTTVPTTVTVMSSSIDTQFGKDADDSHTVPNIDYESAGNQDNPLDCHTVDDQGLMHVSMSDLSQDPMCSNVFNNSSTTVQSIDEQTSTTVSLMEAISSRQHKSDHAIIQPPMQTSEKSTHTLYYQHTDQTGVFDLQTSDTMASTYQHPDHTIIRPRATDENALSHQSEDNSFTGSSVATRSLTGYHQPPSQSFIGPQIPEETPMSYQQAPPQTFIGPQIPDNYTKPQRQQEVVLQEHLDSKYSFSPASPVLCVNEVSSIFMKSHVENYLRGCKWSPDGTQILTNSNDNVLRTFVPTQQSHQLAERVEGSKQEMAPTCAVREGAIIYDFCWFPGMEESKPETCRLACSCPGSPMHLWDSQDGRLVSSYRAFDHCDEVTSAYSLSFSPDGSKLYGGYKNAIRIFDTEYSHRKCELVKTLNPKTKEGHKGIISCFGHGPPGSNIFVSGSYSKHVGIYYSLTNELMCLIQGQQGGVTHIVISPDGNCLYTGGRKDPEIVCWDMRNTGHVLCTYLRDVQTNQRIYFDLSASGRYLVSGNHDGSVQVWDTLAPAQQVAGDSIMRPCHSFQAHEDCVNGVSFNHHLSKLATVSGQRHFKDFDSDNNSDEENGDDSKMEEQPNPRDFSLKIWDIPSIVL